MGISTLGFRGEALSSLVNISQKVTILTKPEEKQHESLGYQLSFDSNTCKLTKSSRVPKSYVGTTVSVSQLFSRLPVRRKDFEKNLNKQFKQMMILVQNYALFYHNIQIIVKNDNKIVQSIPKTSNRLSRLSLVFTGLNRKDFLEMKTESKDKSQKCQISGVLSKPSNGASSSSSQPKLIFVNSRPVQLEKYEKLILDYWKTEGGWRHHYPLYCLNIEIENSKVDVNCAPDKRKIIIHQSNTFEGILIDFLKEAWDIDCRDVGKVAEVKIENKTWNKIIQTAIKNETAVKKEEVIVTSPKKRKAEDFFEDQSERLKEEVDHGPGCSHHTLEEESPGLPITPEIDPDPDDDGNKREEEEEKENKDGRR